MPRAVGQVVDFLRRGRELLARRVGQHLMAEGQEDLLHGVARGCGFTIYVCLNKVVGVARPNGRGNLRRITKEPKVFVVVGGAGFAGHGLVEVPVGVNRVGRAVR